ncbi:YciI family protein [Stieleria sp. JC731]|uniref:YciI family protein n=1 Tax=Pirellulaceae TaxID=2691357 RepID=UPI001E420ED2|nr:YciI family protein [Stieleria sp. JC731]MCC9603088.1 YciI family protein [Stieleria sp. JC731]
MPRYLLLSRGACENPSPEMTPEQMQEKMQSCMRKGQNEGWLIDPGAPLNGGSAVVDSGMNVIDGPFIEAKELIGGYTIIEAPTLAAACELAKKTIEMAGAAKIEVREIAGGGMPE